MIAEIDFTQSAITVVNNFAAPVVVGSLAAWVTAHLALRRFRLEKWWERKADAYARVLESLHVMKRGLEDDLKEMYERSEPTDKKLRDEAFVKYRMADDEVLKAVDTGSFLMSGDAQACLDRLMQGFTQAKANAASEVPGHGTYFDAGAEVADDLGAIKLCLQELPAIARRDLAVRGGKA